jgi:hypothetical protein
MVLFGAQGQKIQCMGCLLHAVWLGNEKQYIFLHGAILSRDCNIELEGFIQHTQDTLVIAMRPGCIM